MAKMFDSLEAAGIEFGSSDKPDFLDTPSSLQAEAVKREEEDKQRDIFEDFKSTVKNSVINHIKNGTAPWLQSHDGNEEKSFFPSNGYIPSGLTAVWLKIREQELNTKDPRWFSRTDIFKANSENNEILIKTGEKATLMSFIDNGLPRYALYFNASQLTGIEPYEQKEYISFPTEIYHPEKINDIYHPRDTLRADLTNWFNSLESHSPYTPRGLNRTKDVASFLENSKSGTFFFIARDAAKTSQQMIHDTVQKEYTNNIEPAIEF